MRLYQTCPEFVLFAIVILKDEMVCSYMDRAWQSNTRFTTRDVFNLYEHDQFFLFQHK